MGHGTQSHQDFQGTMFVIVLTLTVLIQLGSAGHHVPRLHHITTCKDVDGYRTFFNKKLDYQFGSCADPNGGNSYKSLRANSCDHCVRSCADWLEDATTGLGFHISWNQTDTDTANFTRTSVASNIFLFLLLKKETDQKSEKVDLNSKNVQKFMDDLASNILGSSFFLY